MKRTPKPSPAPPPSTLSAQPSLGLDDAPSLPAIVAGSYIRLNIRHRARMLGRLLATLGPLALAVVGGGAFAKYVSMARWPEIPVSFDDAARATTHQIHEIVRYVEQSNPQIFSQLLTLLARDTTTIAAITASIAALGIRRLAAADAARAIKQGVARRPFSRRRGIPTV